MSEKLLVYIYWCDAVKKASVYSACSLCQNGSTLVKDLTEISGHAVDSTGN